MPQMAPYNWLILFLMFNSMMIIIISLNYFNKINKFTFTLDSLKKKNYSWMW